MLSTLEMLDVTPLVRYHDGIELPAVGEWPIHTTSHAGIALRDGRCTQARVANGAMTISEDPTRDGFWMELVGADGSVQQLIVGTSRVVSNTEGFARWHLTGSLCGDEGAIPVEITLDHRGVYRKSGRAWSWITGVGTSEPTGPRWRKRPDVTLSFDLLTVAPAH